MNPIEAAAREIAYHCEHKSEEDVARIINRHLFPVVMPEDVEKQQRYWCLIDGNWYVAIGWAEQLIKDAVEIRGPIPMPEVRS